MKSLLLSTLFVFLFFVPLCEAQQRATRQPPQKTERGETYALLIGINEYPSSVPSLDFCVKDAKVLATTFVKIGVPKKNIYLMVDDAKVDYQPTRNNIIAQIKKVTQLVTENDRLIVSFSGHGVLINRESYLCPRDMNARDTDPNSLVSRKWVTEMLEKAPAKKKLFLVDACREELKINTKSVNGLRSLNNPLVDMDSEGFAILVSCKPKQVSLEDAKNLKQGIFTHFVAQGLQGKADENKDNNVTLEELYYYVMKNTRDHAQIHYDTAQVPMRGGEYSGDFILVSLPQPPPPTSKSLPRKAGTRAVLKIKGVEYPFRWCPPGTFLMGSPKNEAERHEDETQHQVTLLQGFWMLETEVTQEMWVNVTGKNPSRFQGAKRPVEQVSWDESQLFIQKLNALSVAPKGYQFSLPTEAQWEYACRAGTTTPFHFGSDLNGYKANSNGDYPYGTSTKGPYLKATAPVGSYPANAWGLFDMHGNVYEWCNDRFGPYPKGSVSNPAGASQGTDRVSRGGAWSGDAGTCRSALRYRRGPSYQYSDLGVRFVLVHTDTSKTGKK